MNKRSTVLLFSLPMMLIAATMAAQTMPYEAEFGYRFLDLKGSEAMYRTQVNEREGFLIRTVSYTSNEFAEKSLMDRFRLDASDLGAGPAGSLRLEFGKGDTYRFNLGYRHTNDYSANPLYANPFLDQGVGTGQHTYNRDRNLLDADLQFFPGGRIAPFVGFSWNRWDGPGTTTYHVGQDDFQLAQNFTDRSTELRIGSGFTFGNYYGSITQGWRKFETTDNVSLLPGATGGNAGGVLGHDINASAINRADKTTGSTPFTNFFAAGTFITRLKVIADYVRFSADSQGDAVESASGSFASFALGRFFSGIDENATSSAHNTTWRGGARAEFMLTDKFDLFAGYRKESRELNGAALVNTIFLASTDFGGGDLRDITTVLDASSSMNRKEDLFDVAVQARALGPFSFRAGYSMSKQNVDMTPDVSEIVIGGPSQGGSYDRSVNTLDLNGTFAKNGFAVGASLRKDSADDPIFRTDYLDRDRVRVRAGWLAPSKFIRVGITAEETKQNNDRSDIQYDAKYRQYVADVEVHPRNFTVRAAAGRFRADTSILYRRPETFATATSIHTENGKSLEAGFGFFIKRLTVDADFARFDNSGTTPFKIDRVRTRFVYDFRESAGVSFEWSKDKYDDALFGQLANFDANRYGIYLRYHP